MRSYSYQYPLFVQRRIIRTAAGPWRRATAAGQWRCILGRTTTRYILRRMEEEVKDDDELDGQEEDKERKDN